MKLLLLFPLFASVSCSGQQPLQFTGSTPAGETVRYFLGIPPADSVDFIRWYLDLHEKSYTLSCTWGISKPNTNGFKNNGTTQTLKGNQTKNGSQYLLTNGKRQLHLQELNSSLLHILDTDKNLARGNGGWSYTLNALSPVLSDQLAVHRKPAVLKDSIRFEGRTPCGVPGMVPEGRSCYKLKWLITLYAGNETGKGEYLIKSTGFREGGGRRGKWEMVSNDGKVTYRLYNVREGSHLNLLQLDEAVVIFTDSAGNLLVGDHDFSYTLSKIK